MWCLCCIMRRWDGVNKIVGSIMFFIDGHDWKEVNIYDTLSVVMVLLFM